MQFNLGRPSAKNINVQLAGVPLEGVSEYTYLGFKIDILWNLLQCTKACKHVKLNNLGYTLTKIWQLKGRLLFTKPSFLATQIILAYLPFSKKKRSKLLILQNKCIQVILNLPKRTNVDSHHVKLKLLHVDNRRYFNLMKYCYLLSFDMDSTVQTLGIHTRQADKILLKVDKKD